MKGLGIVVLEKEDFFKDFIYEKLISPGLGHFWPGGHNLNKLGRGPLGDDIYQTSKI